MNKFLVISLNKASYFPDEFIDGSITLNSSTQVVLSDILISLFLLENWLELSSVPVGETNREQLLIMNLNIKRLLKLNSELINLPPGTFIFPFRFKLPKNLNPCFEYPSPVKKAYIRYSLETQIVSPYIHGITSTYILLKSRPKIEINNNKLFTSSLEVYKWNMFSEGNTTLNVSLLEDETNIKIGGSISFKVNIDNSKGKLTANEIKVVLMRAVNFKKKITKETKDSIDNECIVQKFNTKVNPGENKSFNFSINLKDMDKDTFNLKNENLPYSNINDMSFFLPSVNSSILECTYRLRVTLYFESFVAYKHRPRVFIPINICHQSMQEYQANSYINQNINNIQNNINMNNIQNINNIQNNINNQNNINIINENNIDDEEDDLPNKEEIEKNNNDYIEENMDAAPLCEAPAPTLVFNNNDNNNINN